MEVNKIKYVDFPQALKDKVDEIRKEQKYKPRILDNHSLAMLFKFSLTEEGSEYWIKLYESNNFSSFKPVTKKLKDKILKGTNKGAKISEVQDSEGSIYKIGDIIRIFEKTCRSHNQIVKIIGFRWNNTRTNICAVTTMHNNGIRLDWIEHYVEIKKEPEFVLPKKWYIIVQNKEEAIVYKQFFKTVLPTQQWVFGIDFIYGHNGIHYSNGQKLYCQEITFEQFKQYVLFDGLKVGDRINTLYSTNVEIIDLQYINGQSVVFYKLDNGVTGNWTRVLLQNIKK